MPTTSDILNEVRTPKYINCKHGFLKIDFDDDNRIAFAGFTPNMRTATPLYCSNGVAVEIAKKLLHDMPMKQSYFVLVEPCMINFNKEKEL